MNVASVTMSALYQAGIARASIHTGDLWKGRQMVMECADPSLYIECADIYEEMKLFEVYFYPFWINVHIY
jgi:hypothetical protein